MSRPKNPSQIRDDFPAPVLPPAGGVYERLPDGSVRRIEGTDNFGEVTPPQTPLETPSKEA